MEERGEVKESWAAARWFNRRAGERRMSCRHGRTTLDEGKRRGSNIHLIRWRSGQIDSLCNAGRKTLGRARDTHSTALEIGNQKREMQEISNLLAVRPLVTVDVWSNILANASSQGVFNSCFTSSPPPLLAPAQVFFPVLWESDSESKCTLVVNSDIGCSRAPTFSPTLTRFSLRDCQ